MITGESRSKYAFLRQWALFLLIFAEKSAYFNNFTPVAHLRHLFGYAYFKRRRCVAGL